MTGKLRKVFLGLGLTSCLSAMSVGCVFAEETAETGITAQAEAEEEITTAEIVCDDEHISEQTQKNLAYSSEGFLEIVMEYSEEELSDKVENGSDFEAAIASQWQDAKEDLGAMVSVQQHEISESNDIYTVVTTVQCEKKDADLTVTYNGQMQPMDAVIDVEQTMGQKMQEAGLNFILGIGTVFIMLIFLSFVISLLKPVTEAIEGKNKKAPAPAAPVAPAAPAVVEEEEEELVDDLELVAVITAAIAASENTSSDGFVVRSIKRANNRKWQKA